jgi:hypothetical protein
MIKFDLPGSLLVRTVHTGSLPVPKTLTLTTVQSLPRSVGYSRMFETYKYRYMSEHKRAILLGIKELLYLLSSTAS